MSNDYEGILITPRLRLVPATRAMIDAELADRSRLGLLLGAAVPSDWPPEHHDRETLMFWRGQLADPAAAGWWLHYALLSECESATLVGSMGFKGPAKNGVVEIGYSVVPSWQRRGLATEASRALLDEAWARGANTIVAHTLEHLTPSLGVLHKLGFARTESSDPDELEFTLRRA